MIENFENLFKKLSFWCFLAFGLGLFISKTLIYLFLFIFLFLFLFRIYQAGLKNFWLSRRSFWKLDLVIISYCLLDLALALLVFFTSPEESSKSSFLKEIFKDRFVYLLVAWFTLTSISQSFSLKEKRKIISTIALSGLFVSLFVILQFVFPAFRSFKLEFIGGGSFGFHSGIFTNCALLILSSFACLHLSQSFRLSKKLFQEFFLLCFLSHFLALVLIGQKSCIFGIAGGFLVWLFFFWSKLKLNSRLILLAGFLISPSLMIVFYEPVRITFLEMIKPSLAPVSYDCRINLWKENLQDYLQDSFWQQLVGDGELIRSKCLDIRLAYAHNIFLQKLFVNGAISLLNFLFLLIMILKRLFNSGNYARSIFAGLIALILEGFFEDWISFASILVTLLFYLSIFLKNDYKKLN